MIIYLTSTKSVRKHEKKILETVEKTLIKNSCKILGNNTNKFSPEKLLRRTENEIKKQYSQMSKDIRKSVGVIALINMQSAEIGKEISEAIQEKIPTLILISDKTKRIKFPKDEKTLIRYKTVSEQNVQQIVEEFLKEISKQISTRFTLVIPSNIDKYINWLAKENGVSKASILRDAVNDIKERSGIYKDHLN